VEHRRGAAPAISSLLGHQRPGKGGLLKPEIHSDASPPYLPRSIRVEEPEANQERLLPGQGEEATSSDGKQVRPKSSDPVAVLVLARCTHPEKLTHGLNMEK
jgi:hypothetical protein